MTIPSRARTDFPGESAEREDILSVLLDSLDVECTTIETMGISRSKGMCTCDLGPVFYVVTEGGCRFHCPDANPIELGRGDLLVLCQGGEHGLSHAPASRPPHLDVTSRQGTPTASVARNGDQMFLLRGYLRHSAPRAHPLWFGLPDTIHVKNVMDDRCDPVLAGSIRSVQYLLSERMDGSTAIMSLLGRLLILEIIRKTIDWPEMAESGFSRALSDPELAPVLAQVYRNPARPWTLLGLAHEAGISRSSFARRFKELMEMSLTEWIVDLRMRLAQGLLADPSLGIEQVARKIGYSSAASFSVAFKRWAGHYPSLGRGRSSPRNDGELMGPSG